MPVLRSSKTKAFWAVGLSCGARDSWPVEVVGIGVPLAEIMLKLSVVGTILVSFGISEEVTKVPVAPESSIAKVLMGGGTTTVETVVSYEFVVLWLHCCFSVVPTCQVLSQKQPRVEPPCMSAKVACGLWPIVTVLHSLPVWAHEPWLQQYFLTVGDRDGPELLVLRPYRPRLLFPWPCCWWLRLRGSAGGV